MWVHTQTVADVLRNVLASAIGPLVVNPSSETLEVLVTVLSLRDNPSVRILATEAVLKDARDDFLVACEMADLVNADRIELRMSAAAPTQVVVTDEAVVAVVAEGDRAAGLTTDDPTFVESANEYYGTKWDESEDFRLHTPGISRVRNTLEAELGSDVASDFDDMLEAVETARGIGQGLDEVEISLLAAANNEALFYNVSSWGRTSDWHRWPHSRLYKTSMEEIGLLDTEKVSLDVGRPRQRLLLGDPQLREADAAGLATITQERLAAASISSRW